MLRIAGVASNDTRLLLQGLQNVVQFFGAIFGALLTDKWGRRPQLLVSTALMVLIFVIVAVLNATNPDINHTEDDFSVKSPAQSKAQVAMIFVFGFVYSCGWTPNQSMYPVEVLRYESRAKGMGMYNVSFCFCT
jgi:MFS family permease